MTFTFSNQGSLCELFIKACWSDVDIRIMNKYCETKTTDILLGRVHT